MVNSEIEKSSALENVPGFAASSYSQFTFTIHVTGYSSIPLIKKLGIKPTSKVLLINEPTSYRKWLTENSAEEFNAAKQFVTKKETPDIIHLFVKTNNEFEREMQGLSKYLKTNTNVSIWVSWYKKAAKIPTDLTEDVIRNYALAHGLVDIKVCSVSEEWSGLKLVVPLKNR